MGGHVPTDPVTIPDPDGPPGVETDVQSLPTWQLHLWQLSLVGAGGFLGAVLRFLAREFVQRLFPHSAFPYGTLAVNVVGCLLIGLLAGLAETRQALSPELRSFLLIGLLGGFTTYSTFGYEAFEMARGAARLDLLAYVGLHLVAGLGAVWLGHALGSVR